MIKVDNITKKYGTHTAVDGLSFQAEPGKIYGFLGPNGAGKSTTMNIMTGYIAATEGTVTINGHDILKDAEEAKRCIGYLPELPPLYPEMTVQEYLKFVAELKKIPKARRQGQIEEVMELVMVGGIRGRLIRNLSKGYKQRVGLAQAMLGYPEVVILDEPTVGLDPKQIIEIRDLIRRLGEKHTVILSSHILSEVQAVCHEIMIISRGRLVAEGTPEELTGMRNKSTRIELEVAGTREKAEKVIMSVCQPQGCHFEDSGEAGCVRFVIETDPKEDIRRELFFALAAEEMPIMSLNRLERSLEDIFLELTGGEGEPGQGHEEAEVQECKGEQDYEGKGEKGHGSGRKDRYGGMGEQKHGGIGGQDNESDL